MKNTKLIIKESIMTNEHVKTLLNLGKKTLECIIIGTIVALLVSTSLAAIGASSPLTIGWLVGTLAWSVNSVVVYYKYPEFLDASAIKLKSFKGAVIGNILALTLQAVIIGVVFWLFGDIAVSVYCIATWGLNAYLVIRARNQLYALDGDTLIA